MKLGHDILREMAWRVEKLELTIGFLLEMLIAKEALNKGEVISIVRNARHAGDLHDNGVEVEKCVFDNPMNWS